MEKAVVVALVVAHFGIDKEATENEISALLKKAGFYGDFTGVVRKKVKGAQKARKVVVGSFDLATKTVIIRSQLEGRGSNYQIALNVPEPYRQNLEEFFNKLKETQTEQPSRTPKKKAIPKDKAKIDIKVAEQLFADEDLLQFVVAHLREFFGGKENKKTEEIIACLSELKLECSPEIILEFLTAKGFLSERQEVVIIRQTDRTAFGEAIFEAIERLRQLEMSSKSMEASRQKLKALEDEEVELKNQLEVINERIGAIKLEKGSLSNQISSIEEQMQKIPKVMEVLG